MIDINQLKQGDLLTFNNNVEKFTVEFIERSRVHSGRIVGYDLSKAQYVFNISKEYINDYCTSWKRDGVERLKQDEKKPLYEFCPIDKQLDGEFILGQGLCEYEEVFIHLSDLKLMSKIGDYTFIGYSTNNENPKPRVCKSPLDYCFIDDIPKVVKYAVFMKTSELFVGGE